MLGRDSQPYISYVSNASGKVIRTFYRSPYPGSGLGFDHELIYNADGNISEVKSYDESKVLIGSQVYAYNADKLPETIHTYEVAGGGQAILINYELYEYNAAKQLIKKSLLGPQQTVSKSYTVYSYPAPDQIKEEVYGLTGASPNNPVLVSTTVNQYDNKKSPYSLMSFYNRRVIVSKHNIISSSDTNHNMGKVQIYTVSYVYNDSDYPVKESFLWQGQNFPSVINWSYHCE